MAYTSMRPSGCVNWNRKPNGSTTCLLLGNAVLKQVLAKKNQACRTTPDRAAGVAAAYAVAPASVCGRGLEPVEDVLPPTHRQAGGRPCADRATAAHWAASSTVWVSPCTRAAVPLAWRWGTAPGGVVTQRIRRRRRTNHGAPPLRKHKRVGVYAACLTGAAICPVVRCQGAYAVAV